MQPTGAIRGPREEIIAQSNVRMLIPNPVFVPNKVLIITSLGVIQHTQLNMLNPVKRYPGTQYQIKLPAVAIQKKRSRARGLRCLFCSSCGRYWRRHKWTKQQARSYLTARWQTDEEFLHSRTQCIENQWRGEFGKPWGWFGHRRHVVLGQHSSNRQDHLRN